MQCFLLVMFSSEPRRTAMKRPRDCQELLEDERIDVFRVHIVSKPEVHTSDLFNSSVEADEPAFGCYCGVFFKKEFVELDFQMDSQTSRNSEDFNWFIKLFSTCWIAKQKDLGLSKVRALDCRATTFHRKQFDFYIEFTKACETDASNVFMSKTHSPQISFVQPWVKTLMLGFGVIRPYVVNAFNGTILDPIKICRDYVLENCVGLDVIVVDFEMKDTRDYMYGATKNTYTFQFKDRGCQHEYQTFVVLLASDEMFVNRRRPWFMDRLYGVFAQCMAAKNRGIPFEMMNVCNNKSSENPSLVVRFTAKVKIEKRVSDRGVFTVDVLPDERIVFRQDSLRDLMIEVGAARSYTHESLYSNCVVELALNTNSTKDPKLVRCIRSLWVICRFDLLKSIKDDMTTPQILAQYLSQGQHSPDYELYALIQAMVFYGAFAVSSNIEIIPAVLHDYEQTFNLGSTFNSVRIFLFEALAEKLIPSLAEMVLDILGLQTPKTLRVVKKKPHVVVDTSTHDGSLQSLVCDGRCTKDVS